MGENFLIILMQCFHNAELNLGIKHYIKAFEIANRYVL